MLPALTHNDALSTETDPARAVFAYLSSLSPKGRRSMSSRLNKIAGLLGYSVESCPWHRLSYETLSMLRTRLTEDGLSPASVNTCLAAAKGILRECFRLGMLTAEEWQRVQMVKGIKGSRLPAGRELGQEEVRALLNTCHPSPLGIRDRAIIQTLYSTGLRRQELVSVRLENFGGDSVTVVAKGNKEHRAFLSESARQAVQEWLQVRGEEPGFLFVRVRKGGKIGDVDKALSDQAVYAMLKKRGEAAGLESFTVHDFRRTAASTLLDRGVDIATVSKVLNHSSVTTTARYDRRGDRKKADAARLLSL